MKINIDNERIKRRYLKYMQLAKRFSEDTIRAHERALESWEIFTCSRDFRRITYKQAGEFADWLISRTKQGEILAASTRYQTVRLVRAFYLWLATQPGRSSKSITVALGYLTADRETVVEATSPGRRKVPTLEYVRALADSISVNNEIDARDRALISFLLLSGARASAAATLPIGCFDRQKLKIHQDPKWGVKTKNRKYIPTTLAPFDKVLMKYFLDWVDYLRKEKLYGDEAPLFPRSQVAQTDSDLTYQVTGIEPVFWKNGTRIDQIAKDRARKAGLESYDCHSFRHAHAHLALSKARTGEEQKAISQNIGHKHFATTATVYGHLDDDKVAEIIRSMDFASNLDNKFSKRDLKKLKNALDQLDLTDDGT